MPEQIDFLRHARPHVPCREKGVRGRGACARGLAGSLRDDSLRAGDDGSIVEGCNVENASYGLSMCAERVALFTAISQGKRPIALAVSCVDAQNDSPLASRMPCGACRQVMQELLPAEAMIRIDGVGLRRLSDLLPNPFQLNRNQ